MFYEKLKPISTTSKDFHYNFLIFINLKNCKVRIELNNLPNLFNSKK